MNRALPFVSAYLLGLLGLLGRPAQADPDALWRIVHDQCEPHETRFHSPEPCLAINEDEGIAILKDRTGRTQLLLIPTARVSGIEDPAVLQPGAPNYFQLAWEQTGTVRALADADLPRDGLSLALNSRYGRSQAQLHIHIDCIRPEVRALLDEHRSAIGENWGAFPVPLGGHAYFARRAWTLDRPGAELFQLVAALEATLAGSDMGDFTIVVVGADFPGERGDEPGFILLAGKADLATGDRGNGEELQDHACALAQSSHQSSPHSSHPSPSEQPAQEPRR